jgi:hypothetical protein
MSLHIRSLRWGACRRNQRAQTKDQVKLSGLWDENAFPRGKRSKSMYNLAVLTPSHFSAVGQKSTKNPTTVKEKLC